MTETLGDILIAFPTVVAKTVLTEWLELDSLARLDSAYCNKQHREDLLGMLKSLRHTFDVGENVNPSEGSTDLLKWLMKKELKVSNAKFSADTPVEVFHPFIKYSGLCLQSVELFGIFCKHTMYHLTSILAECCPGLICINSMCCAFPHSWNDALKKFTNLSKLMIDCIDPVAPCASIFSGVSFPLLQTVALSGDGLTDETTLAIVKTSPNIRTLSLVGTTKLSPVGIAAIATQCSNLRAFGLTNVLLQHQGTVEAVVDACPNIVHLNLGYNMCLSDNAVLYAARHLKLQSLCLDDSMLLTNDVLHEVKELLGPTLTTLYVNNCPGFEPSSIVDLVRSCPLLHTLSIGGEEECGDIFRSCFLQALSMHTPALTTLLLDGDNLRDRHLIRVAQYFPHLQHFGALSPRNIKKGISLVVECGTALQSLTVKNQTDQRFRDLWLLMNPKLRICDLDMHNIDIGFHHYDVLTAEV